MSDRIAVVVSRDRSPRAEQNAFHEALLAGLEQRPHFEVIVVPHLYDLFPAGPAVRRLSAIHGDMIVLAWLYPRSAYWVLDAGGIRGRLGRTSSLGEEEPTELELSNSGRGETPDRTIWCFDLRAEDKPESFLHQVDELAAAKHGPGPESAAVVTARNGKAEEVQEATRPRWYPVVDMSRCTDCHECLNFCLFGVYGLDANGAGFVEQPDACRPGCPACARICPAGAILFPQHSDPAIAGHPMASLQAMKLDLSQIFSGIDPATLASRERADALGAAEMPSPPKASEVSPPPSATKSLDDLVDVVDKLDLS